MLIYESAITVTITNLTNDVNNHIATINGPAFQSLLQLQILIFTVSSIIMIYNSAVFPSWIDKIKQQHSLVPLKGSYTLYSTLLLGFCLAFSAGIMLLPATSISSCFPICFSVSLAVWIFICSALILTLVDVIYLVRYLT